MSKVSTLIHFRPRVSDGTFQERAVRYGDPLTTGRQETASERKHRRRNEARNRARFGIRRPRPTFTMSDLQVNPVQRFQDPVDVIEDVRAEREEEQDLRCTATTKTTRRRCKKWAVAGTNKCKVHS